MSASFKETLVLQLTQDLPDSPVPLVSRDGRILDLDEVVELLRRDPAGELAPDARGRRREQNRRTVAGSSEDDGITHHSARDVDPAVLDVAS